MGASPSRASLCPSQLIAMAACADPGNTTLKEVGHMEAQETFETLG